jgi:hypothetical protein
MSKFALAISQSIGPVALLEFSEAPDDGENFVSTQLECSKIHEGPGVSWCPEDKEADAPDITVAVSNFWETETKPLEFIKYLRGQEIDISSQIPRGIYVTPPSGEHFEVKDISSIILIQHATEGNLYEHTESINLVEYLGLESNGGSLKEGFDSVNEQLTGAIEKLGKFKSECEQIGFTEKSAYWAMRIDSEDHLVFKVMGHIAGYQRDDLHTLLDTHILNNLMQQYGDYSLLAERAALQEQINEIDRKIQLKNNR